MGNAMRHVRRAFAGLVVALPVAAITILGSSMSVEAQTPQSPPQNIASAAAALAIAPKAEITNGLVHATVLLPDARRGFYRGTRFDWSGVISSLTYQGQEYYGLWFDQTAPNVRDFVFHEGRVVSGPNTAIMGPAEAFDADTAQGFKEAAPGGLFLKIGVGVLRKPTDDAPYSSFKLYDIVDGGVWTSKPGRDRVEFTHTLSNAASGYGYVYRKTVRLVSGKPEMVIEHSLKNTGAQPLTTTTFNHNFLTLGGSPAGAGLTVETPFALSPLRPQRGDAARIDGKRLVYSRALPDGETMMAQLAGFGTTAADHRFSITNAAGAGYSVVADRPLSAFTVWSIRPTVSAEPFVTLSAAPGETASWTYAYTYAAPKNPGSSGR
jgi:hypothetical protein